MLKAVIFDMDGVLVDSEPVHQQGNRRLMEYLGLDFDAEYYSQFIGSTCAYMWDKMIRDYHITLQPDELMALSDKFVAEINGPAGYPQIPGVADFVRRLAEGKAVSGLKLAVASSSELPRIHRVLDQLGIASCFDVLVSGSQVARPKPAPDTFLKAAELLQTAPQDCLVIEDSWNGMKAAKDAGMVCIGYENPKLQSTLYCYQPHYLEHADYLIQGYEELDDRYLDMVYCHTTGTSWKAFETERLYCREIRVEDLDGLYELCEIQGIPNESAGFQMHCALDGFCGNREADEAYLRSYIKNMYGFYGYGLWMVCDRMTNEVIGLAGLEYRSFAGEDIPELGYVIRQAYRRQGFGEEVVRGILKFAVKYLEAPKLRAIIREENLPSCALIEKLGFTRSGRMDEWVIYEQSNLVV